MYVKKCPSSIRCQDSNSRPLEHEPPPITTRPGLPPIVVWLLGRSSCSSPSTKELHGYRYRDWITGMEIALSFWNVDFYVQDDVENPGFCASKITSTGSSGGSNRKFKYPYTLIRNGGGSSSRKSSHRTASSSSTALRVLCQCLCYCATAVISGMTVAAIFWLHVQLRIQAQDFNSQISKGKYLKVLPLDNLIIALQTYFLKNG